MPSQHILGHCVVIVMMLGLVGEVGAEQGDTNSELAGLIERAQKNPLATAAHERTQAAAAQEREIAGRRWATLDATAFVAPSPRVHCENIDCTQTSTRDVSINIAGVAAGVSLSITQPLYTGGKIYYAREAATAAREANSALEDEVSGRVAVLVAKAYYGYLLAQELLWMLEDGAEHIESGRKTLEEKLKEGAPDATVQDRFRIQTLQAEVKARMADAVHAKGVALASLHALIGGDAVTLKGGLLEPRSYEFAGEDTALPMDPRLRAAQQGAKAYVALEKLATRSYVPDIALVGGINVARAQGVDDPPSAFANDPFNRTSGYVALAARWKFAPVVQAARVRRKRAQKREAEAIVEATTRLAQLERKTAVAEAHLAQARLNALKDGERAGRAWVASVLQADAIGAASAKDLADAYLAHFTSRAQVLNSTYAWNLAVVELRRQAGEYFAVR